MEPIEAEQRAMREFSAALSSTRLDKLAASRTRDDNTDTALSWNFSPGLPKSPADQRKNTAARQPTFLWRGWSPQTVGETLDQTPLIFSPDGELVQTLGHTKNSLAELIATVSGVDYEVGPRSELGRTRLLRAGLFASCREEHLAAVIEDPRWQLLWPHCVILRPSTEFRLQLMIPQLREGYAAYQTAVTQLIASRRTGGGREFEPGEQVHREIYAFTKELESFANDLPPWARPFFAHIFTLPYRLLWTCEVLLVPGESGAWCLPFTIEATRQVIRRQRDLLISWIDGAAQAEAQRAKITMLRKLADGPCLFRDLSRRYSNQKKTTHQPVLMELFNENLAHLRDDGRLEITPAGRERLVA